MGPIDTMYLDVLQSAITQTRDSQYLVELFQTIVGPIILAMERLSPESLEALVRVPLHRIRILLNKLRSVLIVPESDIAHVGVFHLSFHDFLLDDKQCVDQKLLIDERKTHQYLFKHCLELLSDTLKEDICGLGDPAHLVSDVENDRIETCLPEEVQYACRYWAIHFEASEGNLSDDDFGQLFNFLKTNLLHWLEALSLMKRMTDAAVAIYILKDSFKYHKIQLLDDFILDAKRFILYHRNTIETTPLEVYSSAIIFSPRISLIRAQYEKNPPPWICKAPVIQDRWGQAEQAFVCGKGDIVCENMAIAPDGKTLAVSFMGFGIWIWNVETGQLEQRLRSTSLSAPRLIRFSPDSMALTTVLLDFEVLTWNIATGQVARFIESHPNARKPLVLSPDGTRVAFRTKEATEIRSATTGEIEQIFHEHFGAVAFSRDGTMMASANRNGMRLHIFGPENAVILSERSDFDISFGGLFFSDDSSLLVAWNYKTIVMWHTVSGAMKTAIDRRYEPRSIALSVDNAQLAIASDEGIKVLNLANDNFQSRVIESGFIHSMGFSPDAQTLLCRFSHSVRVIDISTRSATSDSWDISESIRIRDASPDGTMALSWIGDRYAIWNISTGQLIEKIDCKILCGRFSPDSTWLGIDEDKSNYHVWNVSTAQAQNIGAFALGRLGAFSPDSTRIISLDSKDNMYILNLSTHKIQTVGCVGGFYGATVTMSTDNSLLTVMKTTSTRYPDIIEIRCTETASIQHTLEADFSGSWSVKTIFSNDSTQISQATFHGYYGKVQVWDVTTGNLRASFRASFRASCEVQHLAFPPCGTHYEIFMWNIESKELQLIRDIHWSSITSLSFTPDDIWDRSPFYSVDCGGRWVTYVGRRILAIPKEYQPRRIVCNGARLALVNEWGGRAASITFDTDQVVRAFNVPSQWWIG